MSLAVDLAAVAVVAQWQWLLRWDLSRRMPRGSKPRRDAVSILGLQRWRREVISVRGRGDNAFVVPGRVLPTSQTLFESTGS